MRKLLYIFIVISTVATCIYTAQCSHNDRNSQIMDSAEALMTTHPDSALLLINSINGLDSGDNELMARYVLLKTWAEYRNYIDVTDDSQISRATRILRHSGDDFHYMLAEFLRAHILYNSEDYGKAVIPATEATRLSVKLHDTLWMAKCYDLTALIYFEGYMPYDSIEHYQRLSSIYFEHTPYKLNELYAKLNYAITLIDNNKKESAVTLLDSLLNVARTEVRDSDFLSQTLSWTMRATNENKQYEKTLEYYSELKDVRKTLFSNDYSAAAMASIGLGKMAEAKTLLDSAAMEPTNSYDSLMLLNTNIEYFKHTGDFREASRLLDLRITNDQERLIKATTQPVRKALRDHLDREIIKSRKDADTLRWIIWIGVAVILLLAVITFMGVKLFSQKKNNKIEAQLNELLKLSNRLKEYQLNTKRLSGEIEEMAHHSESLHDRVEVLFYDRIMSLDRYCSRLFSISNEEMSNEDRLAEINNEVASLRDKDNIKTLVSAIDMERDNIITRLQKCIPQLSDEDVAMAAMIYAGMSPKTICMLLGLKMKGFYTKRSRLKTKIKESGCADSKEFLYNFQ